GVPRNLTMLKMLESLNPRFWPVGHDGGINVANGKREFHAVAVTKNPSANFMHAVPEDDSLACWDFVTDRIVVPLGLTPAHGPYPSDLLVGNGRGDRLGLFSYEYDPDSPCSSLEITGCAIKCGHSSHAMKSVVAFLARFTEVQHIRAT